MSFTKLWIVSILLTCLSWVSSAGARASGTSEWTASLAGDHETTLSSLLWSPDPNGGVGLAVLSNSYIPRPTEHNVAVGPHVQFYLGDLLNAALDRILPGSWSPLAAAPLRTYGTLSFFWTLDGGDFLFAPGTKTVFFPRWRIAPTLHTLWFRPEGSADSLEPDFKTLLGFDLRF